MRRNKRPQPYRLPLEIEPLAEGGYVATSPALPGFLVQAETLEEVFALAPGVAQTLLEAMREKGVPLPTKLCQTRKPLRAAVLVTLV
ncbi:MAG: type II toxin-antitoxin system HicB family antitoxin [Candidatus Bipolaricaulota bacterium]|nr:type II toxin-antitoxin system HicB family antitoxin [Candidatus Bipolaricaulota bacterium]